MCAGQSIKLRFSIGDELTVTHSYGFPPGLYRALAEETGKPVEVFESPFDVSEVQLEEDGFIFVFDLAGSPWTFLYRPPGFLEFQSARSDLFTAAKLEPRLSAAQVLLRFTEWERAQYAKWAMEGLEDGTITLSEIRQDYPDALREPGLAAMLVDEYIKGALAPLSSKKENAAELELYYLVCLRYINSETRQSIYDCCADIVDERADLVPDSWVSDPAGNLQRILNRKWHKSRWSQVDAMEKARDLKP